MITLGYECLCVCVCVCVCVIYLYFSCIKVVHVKAFQRILYGALYRCGVYPLFSLLHHVCVV
jgi:hypothetical protein